MKKIIIGILANILLIPSYSMAANNPNAKAEVSVPCYNSGLTFGLAGYSSPLPNTNDQTAYVSKRASNDEGNASQNLVQTDYR